MNFRIFEPSEWNLNLNIPDCRDSKIISNNTKLESISWEHNIENKLFNFCVGGWVGEHLSASCSYSLYDIDQYDIDQKMLKKIPRIISYRNRS